MRNMFDIVIIATYQVTLATLVGKVLLIAWDAEVRAVVLRDKRLRPKWLLTPVAQKALLVPLLAFEVKLLRACGPEQE